MNYRPDDDHPEPGVPNARDLADAAQRLQAVGERLLSLSGRDLAEMPLSESLRDAVLEAQRLRPRCEAMRRQLQLIGKLMRRVDGAAVERHLAYITSGQRAAALQRSAAGWRDRLLVEGDPGLHALIAAAPHVDRQRFRQLVRRVTKLPLDTPARREAERKLTAELRQVLDKRPL